MRRQLFALAVLLGGIFSAQAVQPDEVLPDAKLEQRARDLSRELRCMVCQNQSIDDSDAPLARDLRVLVRERLTAGDSNSQVLDYLVARYGQFVLLRPRFDWRTALLWLTPALVLAIGGVVAVTFVRRRNAVLAEGDEAAPPVQLSTEEEARLARLSALMDDRR